MSKPAAVWNTMSSVQVAFVLHKLGFNLSVANLFVSNRINGKNCFTLEDIDMFVCELVRGDGRVQNVGG